MYTWPSAYSYCFWRRIFAHFEHNAIKKKKKKTSRPSQYVKNISCIIQCVCCTLMIPPLHILEYNEVLVTHLVILLSSFLGWQKGYIIVARRDRVNKQRWKKEKEKITDKRLRWCGGFFGRATCACPVMRSSGFRVVSPPSSLFVFLFFSPCAAIFQRCCCGGHKQDPLTIRGEMFKILRRTHTHTHTRAHKTRAMGFGGNPLLFFFFLNIPLYNIWLLWRYIFSFFYDAFKVI